MFITITQNKYYYYCMPKDHKKIYQHRYAQCVFAIKENQLKKEGVSLSVQKTGPSHYLYNLFIKYIGTINFTLYFEKKHLSYDWDGKILRNLPPPKKKPSPKSINDEFFCHIIIFSWIYIVINSFSVRQKPYWTSN